MLKALGWSSASQAHPSSSTAARLATPSVTARSSSSATPPHKTSPSHPPIPRGNITPTSSPPTTLTSDLSPTFFSPTPRLPSPSSNPYLPRPPAGRDATAAWASSGADPRILDVRGRMWGLTRDTRQLDFIPDKDDRTARAKAARSLTAVSAANPRRNDRDDRHPPGARPSSVVEDKIELPWGTYLGQKREKERQKQKDRDTRQGSQWPPKGGSGWMPFWKETLIGRTDFASRVYGVGSAQVMSISTSTRWRADASTGRQSPSLAPPPPLKRRPSAPSPPPSGRPYDPATSPPPLHPSRLASALGLPPLDRLPSLSRSPPTGLAPSASPALGSRSPFSRDPEPSSIDLPPPHLAPPPLFRSTPSIDSPPQPRSSHLSDPAAPHQLPETGSSAALANAHDPDLALNLNYTVDTRFLSAYEHYGSTAKRTYPSTSIVEETQDAADWAIALSSQPRTSAPSLVEYSALPKVSYNVLLEPPVIDRPPHPFDFVLPDASTSSSSTGSLSIALDPRDPDTLKLLVVSIRKFSQLGLTAEAQSIFRRVWPNWMPDHESASLSKSTAAAQTPLPSSPPPLIIYLSVIDGLLGVGMWEDALAWIETSIVKARHEVQLGTYLAFLRAFEWANDPVSAEALFESIKKDSRQPLDGSPRHAWFAKAVFRSLINGGGSASASHRVQTATHWISRMSDEGHQPGPDEWRYLMDAATKADDPALAQKVWAVIQRSKAVERRGKPHNPSRDTFAFNSYLHSLRAARVGWLSVAPVLADAIATNEIVPNLETYHLAIRFAMDGGFVGEAVEMVRFMEDVGVEGQTFTATHATFTILLASLLRRHSVKRFEVTGAERAANASSVRPWTTSTTGDGSGFKLPVGEIVGQTLGIISQMKARGLQITGTIYFAIIDYLGRLPATSETALRLANKLVSDLPKPGEAYTEKNLWAIPQMRDKLPAEEMLLTLIVRVYLNRGDKEMVRAVATDLIERRGEDITLGTVDELMRAASLSGDGRLVHHLWEVALRVAVKDAAGIPWESPVQPPSARPVPLLAPSSPLTDMFSSPSTDGTSPPSPSSPKPDVPLVSASLLCKTTQILLVFYINRGPIDNFDLAYLTEQWRRVASLGFGLDRRCWSALAEVYFAVGEYEKALQIANDIHLWRNETLERRFEQKTGKTVRQEDITPERAASAQAWADEFARGRDELPIELDDAPDEFRKVVRTSFAMGPADFKSKRNLDRQAEAFANVFPPRKLEGQGAGQPHGLSASGPDDLDELLTSSEGHTGEDNPDAPHPSLDLAETSSDGKRKPPPLRHGVTWDHLDLHPSVVQAWKPTFRVLNEVNRVMAGMEDRARNYVGGRRLADGAEDPVQRLERFRARYGRVIDVARRMDARLKENRANSSSLSVSV